MRLSMQAFWAALLLGEAIEASPYSYDASPSSSVPGCPAPPSPSSPACDAVRLEIDDAPYSNYFYSDCNAATQVIVTSPLPDSNLTLIGPRLLVGWPAGNSGLVAFFQPQNGINGSLALSVVNSSTTGNILDPIYEDSGSSQHPTVGVTGHLKMNSSATLTIPILGSIRIIRDFTEGPSLLYPLFQDAIQFSEHEEDGGVSLSRLWLDNVTMTTLSFSPAAEGNASVTLNDGNTLDFTPGTYVFSASFNYPQLEQLSPIQVLNDASQDLVASSPDQVKSLSFLSYSGKLLAGAWRFLTYFGRDSIITMLLTEHILSTGQGGAFEGGIAGVLERIDRETGTVAHEENIGDFATYVNMRDENKTSSAPSYDYKMIDTDYFLPVLLADYLVKNDDGRARAEEFLATTPVENPANADLTYRELALLNARKIMHETAPFAAPGGQTKENLIRLHDEEVTGEWRDSTYGLGGGRIPYNVNAAIVPAGLRGIATLAAAGVFPEHPDWADEASAYAQIWEDETLQFFEVTVPEAEAKDLLEDYVSSNDLPFPAESDALDGADTVSFYAVALEGNNEQHVVRVMNTDDCFRHFLLNTTNQPQLSAFLSQTADLILRPFPAGLSTDVGLLVANPGYGGDPVYAANFTRAAYHGTVVWSWQLAMMAAGLERQLGRCHDDHTSNDDAATARAASVPDFCTNDSLHSKVRAAYNRLWDIIESNERSLSSEMWSWRYDANAGRFVVLPLGDLPPPPGVNPTESNANQLWSLTFLAVERNQAFV